MLVTLFILLRLFYQKKGFGFSEKLNIFSLRTRHVFSFKNLQKIAGQTGFYKRKSDLTPEMFFDLLIYCSSLSRSISLEQTVTLLSNMHHLDITKQSLYSRFNSYAVKFVKEVMKQALELELEYLYSHDLLPQFNYIRIKDSTRFNIDNRLVKQFRGSGGNGTRKACVCIQYEYDIKSGKILDLSITPGVEHDITNAKETKCNINQRDLIIRDLGYYNLEILMSFHNKNAFFVSRLNMTTSIYTVNTQQQISFKELYQEMTEKGLQSLDTEVLVSRGKKIKLRLVISILPEKEYQKRIRRINKINKENGYTTSEDYKARARFNVFITNIQTNTISKDELMLLYKLRWQIELTFKTWKSICAIDKIHPMKYERFVCVLMAKLIIILIRMKLFWLIQNQFFIQYKRILSPYKCFGTFQNTPHMLFEIVKENRENSVKNLLAYIKMFSRNHWKEKRKESTNYEEIIQLFICKSNNYGYPEEDKRRAA